MPLEQRKGIIAGLRDSSRAAQRSKSYEIMDVNAAAIAALFDVTGAPVMIHGHTHRPARHDYLGRVRYVLPDWDCDTVPPRGGWLAIDSNGDITQCWLNQTAS